MAEFLEFLFYCYLGYLAIMFLKGLGSGVSNSSSSGTYSPTTGNTSTTITIYDYVIRCNSTAFTDQGTSSTMAARDEFENVDASSASTKIHPFELLNIHKAHAFNDGTNDLDGTGISTDVLSLRYKYQQISIDWSLDSPHHPMLAL